MDSMVDYVRAPFDAMRSHFFSLDSGAQAVTISELIVGVHPRHVLMEPSLVPFGVMIYLGLKPHFTLLCRSLKTNGKSPLFRSFVLLHNLLLCAFSLWTASNTIPLSLNYYKTNGVHSMYCTNGLWQAGLQYWGFLFYLSKYWELVDTALLIVKGKQPSFLQVYHHAVTIVCSYALQASHSPMTFVFVGLNSIIHTIMYAYYALTVIGVRLGAKSVITSMQLVQFVAGISMAMPTFFLQGGKCATTAQQFGVAVFIVHATVLLKLFADFYRKTYRSKPKEA